MYSFSFLSSILDATKQLFMSGNMLESKKAKFNIWRTEDSVVIPDVKFSLSLNHSRLLSSALEWRIDLKDNIVVCDILSFDIIQGEFRKSLFFNLFLYMSRIHNICTLYLIKNLIKKKKKI